MFTVTLAFSQGDDSMGISSGIPQAVSLPVDPINNVTDKRQLLSRQ